MTAEGLLNILKALTEGFFIHQFLTIMTLYLFGYLWLRVVCRGLSRLWNALIAYPAGLSLYSLTGCFLIFTGIPFRRETVITGCILIMIVSLVWKGGIKLFQDSEKGSIRLGKTICSLIIPVFIALAACSGIFRVSISNDSVYYYSAYPSFLTAFQGATPSMDIFLTNVGQATAVINSLPFLFGFDESFGIQLSLCLNFILIFIVLCFNEAGYRSINDGKPRGQAFAAVIALIMAAVLITSEPFLVISSWILSNSYFMVFLFLTLIFGRRAALEEAGTASVYPVTALFVAMLSLIRMEGGIVAGVSILCISCLPVKRKPLLLYFILPLCLSQVGYYGMLFIKMGVSPLYGFQDYTTGFLMLSMIIGLIIYAAFIRNKLSGKNIPLFIIMLLLMGNIGLLVFGRGRYVSNLKAFYQNIRQGNGWGYSGILFIVFAIILGYDIIYKRRRPSFFETTTLSLILIIIAAAWARGGVLAVRISDSGNRALLQIFPVLLFTLFERAIGFSDSKNSTELDPAEAQ